MGLFKRKKLTPEELGGKKQKGAGMGAKVL